MPKPKKKLSKAAKEAQKLLEKSTLAPKIKNSSDGAQAVRPAESSPKTSEANKPRPQKKRG